MSQYFPWNGSKRWLIDKLSAVMKTWDGCGVYVDPFVGGGSVSRLVREMFPNARQRLSDANPWLAAAFRSQLTGCGMATNYADIGYWRGLKDADIGTLTDSEQVTRFAVCLFTAWGNRWKSRADGSMGTENPVNLKFTSQDYLRKKLDTFFSVRWLDGNDSVECADWKQTLRAVNAGDLVYIDPPYPESLGYGNQWWSFSDQLDVVDWVADAVKNDIDVVVSNMATIERLYRRAGLSTLIVDGPKTSKTRVGRSEVIAWKISRTQSRCLVRS